jgi:hypothetical protein
LEPHLFSILHGILVERFSEEELKTLCSELGVAYDDLPSEGRSAKARELVLHLARRDRIADLIVKGRHFAPGALWHQAWPNQSSKAEDHLPYVGLRSFQEEDAALFLVEKNWSRCC